MYTKKRLTAALLSVSLLAALAFVPCLTYAQTQNMTATEVTCLRDETSKHYQLSNGENAAIAFGAYF